jgi:hypothetical protein
MMTEALMRESMMAASVTGKSVMAETMMSPHAMLRESTATVTVRVPSLTAKMRAVRKSPAVATSMMSGEMMMPTVVTMAGPTTRSPAMSVAAPSPTLMSRPLISMVAAMMPVMDKFKLTSTFKPRSTEGTVAAVGFPTGLSPA